MQKENIEIITQFTLGFTMVSISLIFLKVGQDLFGKDAALIWAMGFKRHEKIINKIKTRN